MAFRLLTTAIYFKQAGARPSVMTLLDFDCLDVIERDTRLFDHVLTLTRLVTED